MAAYVLQLLYIIIDRDRREEPYAPSVGVLFGTSATGFHRSIAKHRLVAMMFVLHRMMARPLFLLHSSLFRSCLSVRTILSHMSSTVFIDVSALLIRQDGIDAI